MPLISVIVPVYKCEENIKPCVDSILKQIFTDFESILVDDRKILKGFYENFKNTNRVFLIDDCPCEELKGYISKCRFFIGARTHATIAAYSTLVPTLVVGYSVKARGIAKDLFGTYENYVLPAQQIKETDELTKAFMWLQKNEDDIKKHLTDILPEYKARINNGIDALKAL